MVMVNVLAVPGHPASIGVTVIVAVTGAAVLFIVTNEPIFPLPFAGRPIDGLLLVQSYKGLGIDPVKATAFVDEPLHNNWLTGWATVGVGFTVMVNDLAGPGHPIAIGRTVIVAIKTAPLLIAVNEGISPVPLAASPIEGAVFVQV